MTPPVFVIDPDAAAAAAAGSLLLVSGPEGRHAVTVRRIVPGEVVVLVDGRGRRIDGRVRTVTGKDAFEVEVIGARLVGAPEPTLTVVQALPKGDRGELAVELLTEIGVDVIVPWSAANCVTRWRADRAEKSWQRWSDAARAAAKQSRRSWFPLIAPLASTVDVVARITSAAAAIVLHESAAVPIGRAVLPEHGEVVLVVGPEGGLAPDELRQFAEAGATAMRMGPTVLRTSTAGVAAVSALLSSSARWNQTDVEG